MERKVAFNQKASNLGRRWTHVPKKQLRRFCSAMKVLKGKGEVISVNNWDGGQNHCHPPLHAGLSTSCDLSLDIILFTQFVQEIAEREAREEIGRAHV